VSLFKDRPVLAQENVFNIYEILEDANDNTLPCFVTNFRLIGTFRIAIRK
jgi:hypothetical protein